MVSIKINSDLPCRCCNHKDRSITFATISNEAVAFHLVCSLFSFMHTPSTDKQEHWIFTLLFLDTFLQGISGLLRIAPEITIDQHAHWPCCGDCAAFSMNELPGFFRQLLMQSILFRKIFD